jgi:hypothetical protein
MGIKYIKKRGQKRDCSYFDIITANAQESNFIPDLDHPLPSDGFNRLRP